MVLDILFGICFCIQMSHSMTLIPETAVLVSMIDILGDQIMVKTTNLLHVLMFAFRYDGYNFIFKLKTRQYKYTFFFFVIVVVGFGSKI
ncbi:hypothetical protein KUTeg_010684 [Tegillarca granosa]|uniref:Uncharacterized protein n=1 Tax=Tegillarca granosa TaxID=220873 RepID=A0ABQ9F1R4_TEGGR|nr:hypothetical protein KUTeg_010684 [Tegillarca granosa]